MPDKHDPDTPAIPQPDAHLPAAAPVAALSPAEAAWRLTERQAVAISRATDGVPKHFRGKPGDIVAAWIMADELGISRMAMLRSAFVVNGRVQLSGDLLLAVARGAGVKVSERIEDGEAEGELVATCEATLPGGETVAASFSTGDAQAAGLWGSSDPWRKYPKRMLQMRARGFCLRDAVADKLAGVYAPGELIEGEAVDITPAG